jgi:hypothetical protein
MNAVKTKSSARIDSDETTTVSWIAVYQGYHAPP